MRLIRTEPYVWIAETPDGARVQAERDLAPGDYRCPMCKSPTVLKRGQKVAAHFAHSPDSDCPASEPESWRHLLAKRVLVDEFTARGWASAMEVCNVPAGRRVDVGVEVPTRQGVIRIAVEVQDSAIQVNTMKARIAIDRRIGYDATVWLFTSQRAAALMYAEPDHEIRVPDEMLWVDNRYGQGVQIIDPDRREMWIAALGSVHRDGASYSWYTSEGDLTGVDYSGRTLRKTKSVDRKRGGFNLRLASGKFGDRWSVVFDA